MPSETKKTSRKSIVTLTPLIALALTAAVAAAAVAVPLKKSKTLLDLAFSADPKHAQINEIKYDTKEVESEIDGNRIVYPSFGMQYATLKIDSIGLEAPVIWGSSDDLLKEGVCQYVGSVFIGEKGNVVLNAHSNTFFSDLQNVKTGDTIVLTTSYGDFTYKAKEQVIFKETDSSYVLPTAEDRLTMYTYYGNTLGLTEDRIAVVCELVEKKFYE